MAKKELEISLKLKSMIGLKLDLGDIFECNGQKFVLAQIFCRTPLVRFFDNHRFDEVFQFWRNLKQ